MEQSCEERGPSCVMVCLELRSFSEPRIIDPNVKNQT